VQVKGTGGTGSLTGAVDLGAGTSHVCAVKSDGTVWCWGRNDKGQLGDNTTTNSLVPVQVKGAGGTGTLAGAASIGLGQKHSCTIRTNGTVWCWGLNNIGQLGDDTTTDRSAPVPVVGTGGAGSITDAVVGTAGANFSCAIRTGGTTWCWGDNIDGQLGDGTMTDSSYPSQVL